MMVGPKIFNSVFMPVMKWFDLLDVSFLLIGQFVGRHSYHCGHEIQFITCGVNLVGLELTALVLNVLDKLAFSRFLVKFHDVVVLDQRL